MGSGSAFTHPSGSAFIVRSGGRFAARPRPVRPRLPTRSAWLSASPSPLRSRCAADGALPRASGSRAAPTSRAGAQRASGGLGGCLTDRAVRAVRVRVAQRLAPTSDGMSAVDAPGGDWPAALACMRTARDRAQACMADSGCHAALAYSRAVGAWVGGLPEDGGSRVALQQPDSVRSTANRLPAQPPALQQARVAFTEAVRRARSLAARPVPRGMHLGRGGVSKACTLTVRALAASLIPRRRAAVLHGPTLRVPSRRQRPSYLPVRPSPAGL